MNNLIITKIYILAFIVYSFYMSPQATQQNHRDGLLDLNIFDILVDYITPYSSPGQNLIFYSLQLYVAFFAFYMSEKYCSYQNISFMFMLLQVIVLLELYANFIADITKVSFSLIYALAYIQCRRQPNIEVMNNLKIYIQSKYFPLVIFAFTWLLTNQVIPQLLPGLIAGHIQLLIEDLVY